MKILTTGATITKVDDFVYEVYYKDEFIKQFNNKASALMFSLSKNKLEQQLQLKLKSA
tara:strand:- start:81 stop:254 length:174 start_codon:yes stop_codon:yes gene_type:complete